MLLAAGISLAGAGAANAAGGCVEYRTNGGDLTAFCTGTPTIRWECSADPSRTVYARTLVYGPGFASQKFRVCDLGSPRLIRAT
ncbi:hypothetical protein [Microbacterium rhizomatis]|uniref:Secreted protein n=1 Tax=Microbacterium rhizomatis TaxID=1631477 RepID=A0A5J5J4W1_9MICO|nr:hypothetical protein [Microbacterium rhizomatis]KAA9111126.1 hypothetical protein F6B43_05825 [Microbacterium rhizomatis]